ncbi:MAG: ABC transporter substrate-binding protein [Gammaproteobacteria bacterium]
MAAIVVAGWLQVAAAGPNGPVERIVSLAPHLTELAYAAGAGDKLVGTVEYSDFPLEAGRLPRIGDAFRIDYEQVALLEPDLVLAWGSGTPAEIIAKLTALGYRVIELEPGSIESIAAELRQIGTLGSHVISEIIEDCGGINVFAAAANIAPAVSKEAIVAAKPDVILAATSPGDDDWADVWRSWQQIPAVRDGHLFGIDRDLISRSGPRIVDGALQVCEALEKSRALPGKQLNY